MFEASKPPGASYSKHGRAFPSCIRYRSAFTDMLANLRPTVIVGLFVCRRELQYSAAPKCIRCCGSALTYWPFPPSGANADDQDQPWPKFSLICSRLIKYCRHKVTFMISSTLVSFSISVAARGCARAVRRLHALRQFVLLWRAPMSPAWRQRERRGRRATQRWARRGQRLLQRE